MPWCDMCTFPLTVELCVKIGGFEMAHEGVSSDRKLFFFFLMEWNVFQLNPQLAEFSILLFSPLKNPFPLTSLCILQQYIPSQCISLQQGLYFIDQWHQNCSIWSFMAFSDLVGFLIMYCAWDLSVWLKCHLESTWPPLGRAGARKVKLEKKKDGKKQKAGDDQLLGKSWKCLWVVVGNIHTLPSPFLMHCHLLQLKASSSFLSYCSIRCDVCIYMHFNFFLHAYNRRWLLFAKPLNIRKKPKGRAYLFTVR